MPKFKGTIIKNRPFISVLIKSLQTKNDTLSNNQSNDDSQSFKALIDTGATTTSISSNLVQSLNLLPSGMVSMQSATHIVEANVYGIQLGIPITEVTRIDDKIIPTNHHVKTFQVQAIEAVNLQNQGIDVLLGMDIISHCLLIVEGNQFTFCF